MSISENLTQQKLQEILMSIYEKGNENQYLKVTDVIDEIRQQVTIAIGRSD